MKLIKTIKIENKKIGPGNPCFIIAEAGVNHNGDITLAKKLIDAAVEAGADAIKFQIFQTNKIVTKKSKKAPYQIRTEKTSQYEMLKELELSYEDFQLLKKYCDNRRIEFIATPYDKESAFFLKDLNLYRVKIASADIINKALLKDVAQLQKQILLSVGMANLGEIEQAIDMILDYQNSDIILMHCTTSYPTPFEQVNMKFLDTLQQAFGFPVGYSDHTIGLEIPLMAVSLGAVVVEKHFTLDRKMNGPDHFASIEPPDFLKMVTSIRNLEKAFGNGTKAITEEEKKNIFFMRRSVHAGKDLIKNDIISEENIHFLRPNDGIGAWNYDAIIGKKIKNPVKKGDPIQWSDIE